MESLDSFPGKGTEQKIKLVVSGDNHWKFEWGLAQLELDRY